MNSLPRPEHSHPRIRLLKDSNKTYSKLEKPRKCYANKWAKYYGSMSWHRLREAKLMDQPLCEYCLAQGRVIPAECVHHRIVFGDMPTDELRWKLFLDMDNLVSLCNKCHQHIHNTNDPAWVEHF